MEEGDEGSILVKETPFYATMGGQEGDFGTIVNAHGLFRVLSAIRLQGGKIAHKGVMESGSFALKDIVTLKVDPDNRENT